MSLLSHVPSNFRDASWKAIMTAHLHGNAEDDEK